MRVCCVDNHHACPPPPLPPSRLSSIPRVCRLAWLCLAMCLHQGLVLPAGCLTHRCRDTPLHKDSSVCRHMQTQAHNRRRDFSHSPHLHLHAHTHARARTHAHTRVRARTHKHTHTLTQRCSVSGMSSIFTSECRTESSGFWIWQAHVYRYSYPYLDGILPWVVI